MNVETKFDGEGNQFEIPVDYREPLPKGQKKIRKKNTNFTPKKKKRK